MAPHQSLQLPALCLVIEHGRDIPGQRTADQLVDGAELEQSDPTDRRARMKVPSQDPGDYEFKVGLDDDDFERGILTRLR